MATIEHFTGWSFDNDQVTGYLDYNASTFAVDSISFKNLSSQNCVVTVFMPSGSSFPFTLAANTQQTTVSLRALHLTMATATGTDKFGHPITSVNLPTGWDLSAAWPA